MLRENYTLDVPIEEKMDERWHLAYDLVKTVYNLDKGDVGADWLEFIISAGDVPITAGHMHLCESYPSTYDVVYGWRGWV